MQQIYLTKSLAKRLMRQLSKSPAPNTPALQWYADAVHVDHHSCIAAIESQSCYCMLFAGLSEKDLANFDKVFAERVWREACVISQLDKPLNDDNIDRLHDLANMVVEEQHYQIHSDSVSNAYFREIKEDIDVFIRYQDHSFPSNSEEAFKMGIKINEIPRMQADSNGYFQPLEQFQNFWLGLLDYTQEIMPQPKSNVVHVNFGRK